jgi:flagellar protein FliO/FliZ
MTKSIPLSRAVAPAIAALGACLLAFASPASAFTPSTKSGGENTPLNLGGSTGASHSTSSGGASIVRTIVGLAIVIGVIWGLAWIMRQVKAGRDGGRDAHQSSAGLASIAALTLGSGRSVHLVRAGNDYVLLGATEHGVAPIHRYTEEQALDAGLLAEPGSVIEQPVERSRLISAASQILRPRDAASQILRPRDAASQIVRPRELPAHSPVVGHRPDPMSMPSPSSSMLERLREMTVRR